MGICEHDMFVFFPNLGKGWGGGAQIWDDVKNGGRGFTFSIPVVIIFSVLIAAQLENVFSLLLKFC